MEMKIDALTIGTQVHAAVLSGEPLPPDADPRVVRLVALFNANCERGKIEALAILELHANLPKGVKDHE